MAFDVGSIPAQVLRSIADGLATPEICFADEICTRVEDKTTLSGTVPVRTSVTTLSRSTEAHRDGLPPGVEAAAREGGMTTTNYNCLAFVGRAFVTDEERNDLSVYGLDQVSDRARQAKVDADFKVDYALEAVLESTTLNNEFDCNSDGNGEWDDFSNGTPLQDFQEAKLDFAPMADTLVYGPETRRALIAHPDIIAEFSQFSAGQIDDDGLKVVLARKLGIPVENIFYFEKLFNSAAEGQDVSTAYLFDEGAWLGHKRDLIMVDPQNNDINNKLEIERNLARRAHEVQYTRYVDIIRPTQDLGVYFSNVIT